MSSPLQEGINQLHTAGNDKYSLGMALISLHGALEDYFRDNLASEITTFERQQGRRTGWQDLVDLWEKHKRPLSFQDRDFIFSMNTLRNKVAHAKPYHINRAEIERYSRFVQNFLDVHLAPTVNQTPSPPPPPSRQPTQPSCLRRLIKSVMFLILACGLLTFALFYFLDDSDTGNVSTTTPGTNRETSSGEEKEGIPMTIQVVGNSYLRAGPGQDFNIVGTVMDDEIYEVLETSDNGQWYKIKAQSGQEGWLGSTRATEISP